MIFVIAVLAGAVILFITEWLRVDVVALSVLLILAIFGFVTHEEAIAGFSNKAVITIASVLVLSAGLVRTGVAQIIGGQILRLSGDSDLKLLVIMMLVVGSLSGIMNNIGVAALMLPVIMEIAHRTGRSPSKLLIPLAFASLFGGLTTLIATAPNILISTALESAGFAPFKLFDFTPIGVIAMAVGVLYLVVAGRHLLPDRDLGRSTSITDTLRGQYELNERLLTVTIPEDSPLTNRNLAESRLGSALGFNVMAILRGASTLLAPGPDTELHAGDKLLLGGRREQVGTLNDWKTLTMKQGWLVGEHQVGDALKFAEMKIAANSALIGKTFKEAGPRNKYSINILAVIQNGRVRVSRLRNYRFNKDDVLIGMGRPEHMAEFEESKHTSEYKLVSPRRVALQYKLHRNLIGIHLPEESSLVGRSIARSHLKSALGINVLGVNRQGDIKIMPSPEEELEADDVLIVMGEPEILEILNCLQNLELEEQVQTDLERLESDEVGVAEVTLSPRNSVAGKTVGELNFRDRFGLSVLAIWRKDRAHRTNLRDFELEPGDALMVYGLREDLARLQQADDFLVISGLDQPIYKKNKVFVAAGIEVGVLASVALGFLPIFIAALTGAILMVLTRCISMDEAYEAIEWRAIMLIAGMLSLGVAMQQSGVSELLAHNMLESLAFLGVHGILAGLFIVTMIFAQIMPTAAVAVLMAPIAIITANDMGLSPHTLAMVVVIASSSAFLSPVGHPVNLLVMGIGGYRFTDYTKVGLPLVILFGLIAVFLVPVFWPLSL
ncbi:MAG: SLC13 family permease [Candidatus Marinimicrobia bacterium]|nr:SLC13 family permease [Candidatus Neomarinimicrobiota bacterium]MCF7850711.1 SLC13 family permease [Candidatus Neomarinimicrobiota bacterium]MCF7904912.1 SLC13 family permease [Candidatus Neomarinimicrobiota bacterium]